MQERPLTTINQAGEDSAPVFEVEEPTDGQVLAYDGDSGKWKNADAGGGSGGGAFVVHAVYDEQEDKEVFDKTYSEILAAARSGLFPVILSSDDPSYATVYLFYSAYQDEDTGLYTVLVICGDPDRSTYSAKYTTVSADGYPSA